MIRNVVFDIGNVLVDFCWKEHFASFGFDEAMVERLGDAMVRTPIWGELDKGIWTDDQLIEGFIKNDPELAEQICIAFSHFITIVKMFPGSVEWVRALKERGYKVYYLSNYAERARKDGVKELVFMEEMDGGIMSYEVQTIKPNEKIYQLLFEKYNLNPEECVFLDDSAANIETGRRLGMKGILVTGQEQARTELDEMLKAEGMLG